MNSRIPVQRLHRRVQSLAPSPRPAPGSEPTELIAELAQAFADEWEQYRRAQSGSSENPDPSQPPSPELIEAIAQQAPEHTSFYDIERLARIDPQRAVDRWAEIKHAAREQLDSGWLAARALEHLGGNAWDRACFKVLRDRLCEAWAPVNVGESLLIDEMAQYEFLRLKWVAVLGMHSRHPDLPQRRERPDKEPRRVTAMEATAEAVRVIERLQRLTQNALRLLMKSRGKNANPRMDWYQALITPEKR